MIIIIDGMELSNKYKIRRLEEKETYKYLGILDADTIKNVEMKDRNNNMFGELKTTQE